MTKTIITFSEWMDNQPFEVRNAVAAEIASMCLVTSFDALYRWGREVAGTRRRPTQPRMEVIARYMKEKYNIDQTTDQWFPAA